MVVNMECQGRGRETCIVLNKKRAFLAHRMISPHTRANALYVIGDTSLSEKKNT